MRILHNITQRMVWLATQIAMRSFCRFYVIGKNNLNNISTPLLVVANHRSYWDSMVIGTLFPFFSKKYLPLGFMAADDFFQNSFYKALLNLTGIVPQNKGKGLDISLKTFRVILSNKGVVVIFPYGKRVYDDNERPEPKRGAPTLVKEFPGLTILPIYLKTTPNLSMKEFFLHKKEMGVIIGQPFQIEQNNDQTIEMISNKIIESFSELNDSNPRKTAL
jgi:1-acyl-sn-glycerol-3-phosphate acyltransferase